MKFNEFTTSAHKRSNRVGRGISAGQGKTAGRGTKGQLSRTGKKRKPGFAGGQIKLTNALPKLRGFKRIGDKPETVYTGDLNQFKGTIDNKALFEAGIISSAFDRARIVVRGELTTKVTVQLQGASAGAVEMIQKAGGSFTVVDRQPRGIKPENAKKAAEKAELKVIADAAKKAARANR